MIRPRDIKQGRPANPMLFRHPDRSFNFGALTGNDDLTGRVDISDIDIGSGSQRTHRVFIRTDHRRHCAGGGSARFIHQFAAPLHQFQSRCEVKRAGRRVRRHFA